MNLELPVCLYATVWVQADHNITDNGISFVFLLIFWWKKIVWVEI